MALFNKNNKKDESNAPETPAAAPNVMADQKPQGLDFNRYFLAERRIFLENISYETTKPEAGAAGYKLSAKDSIVSQLTESGVKITFNRELKFDPEGPFVLSISYSVFLIFNPGTKNEVDWKTVDMRTEFLKNCSNIVATMHSRIALLVAEITSSAGQPPIIMGMPPMRQQ